MKSPFRALFVYAKFAAYIMKNILKEIIFMFNKKLKYRCASDEDLYQFSIMLPNLIKGRIDIYKDEELVEDMLIFIDEVLRRDKLIKDKEFALEMMGLKHDIEAKKELLKVEL
jgi:hypothetical protein